MKPKFTLRYFLALATACGMMAAVIGVMMNAFGVFFLPIARDLGLGQGAVSLMQTISNLCMAVSGMLTHRLVRKWRLRPILFGATLVLVGATVALSFSSSLGLMYLLCGIRGAVGGIVGNVLVVMVINNWFVKNNGTFVSIAMSVSGIIGAAASPVFAQVIESAGWRTGFLVMAGLILLFELPGILSPVDVYPSRVGCLAYGDDGALPDAGAAPEASGGIPAKILLFPLLLMTVYQLAVAFATSYPQFFPGISGEMGIPATTGALLVSVCLVMNTGGKLLLGILADRIGTKRAVGLFSALLFLGPVLLLVNRSWALFPAAVLMGVSYALSTVGSVVLVRAVFGREQYDRVYPKTVLVGTMSGAMGFTVIGFLYDLTGSYRAAFLLLQGLLVLQVLSILLLFRQIAVRQKKSGE